ncbi:hypothetical protein LINGRAHAP2_LOCUS1614 [Linum grandiflorum]
MVDIREMEAFCLPPKHIEIMLNNKYNIQHNMRQIYNYCMKLRKERLNVTVAMDIENSPRPPLLCTMFDG